MSSATTDPALVLTASAYAERRGVTIQSVRTAILSGRIARAAKKNGRRWEIDAELADSLWESNTDQRPRGNKPDPAIVAAPKPAWVDPNPDEDLNEARLRHEKAKADLAEIKREEERGRLVDAETERRQGFETGRLVRDSFLHMVDQLAPVVTAEMDERKNHEVMRRAVIEALRHLCEEDGGVVVQRAGSA